MATIEKMIRAPFSCGGPLTSNPRSIGLANEKESGASRVESGVLGHTHPVSRGTGGLCNRQTHGWFYRCHVGHTALGGQRRIRSSLEQHLTLGLDNFCGRLYITGCVAEFLASTY